MLRYHRQVYEPYLVNAYIGCKDPDLPEDYVYVLLRYDGKMRSGIRGFDALESKLSEHPDYYACWDLDNGQFVMYAFYIPDMFKQDFYKFKNGDYSKMSDKAKDLIVSCSTKKKQVKQIVNKSSKLKEFWENRIGQTIYDQEVWSIWNDGDIFSLDKLSKHKKKIIPVNF